MGAGTGLCEGRHSKQLKCMTQALEVSSRASPTQVCNTLSMYSVMITSSYSLWMICREVIKLLSIKTVLLHDYYGSTLAGFIELWRECEREKGRDREMELNHSPSF